MTDRKRSAHSNVVEMVMKPEKIGEVEANQTWLLLLGASGSFSARFWWLQSVERLGCGDCNERRVSTLPFRLRVSGIAA
jgi:hypothetical protein